MDIIHKCVICMGSNTDASSHIGRAKTELSDIFPHIIWGKNISTEPVGTTCSNMYINCAAIIYTSLSKESIALRFKEIERAHGRTGSPAKGLIPLDIDLVIYDCEVLKPKDIDKAYFKEALSTIRTKE